MEEEHTWKDGCADKQTQQDIAGSATGVHPLCNDRHQPVVAQQTPDKDFQPLGNGCHPNDNDSNQAGGDLQPPDYFYPPDDDCLVTNDDSQPPVDDLHPPDNTFHPPDGGWGWVVCFTSMCCNGTVFGTMNTFGILFVVMLEQYGQGEDNIAYKTSWVASVCTGLTYITCIVASILSDRFGLRTVGVAGGGLAFLGMLSSAFVDQLMLYYLTYGVLLGVGSALAYTPSMVILGHYFKKRLGLVNGIFTLGSAGFTTMYSLALPPLLEKVGLRYCLLCLSGMLFLLIPYALTWRPLAGRVKRDLDHANGTKCQWLRGLFNVTIWRNRAYVIWAVGNGIALFGYFVPYVHIVQHTKDVFPGAKGHLLPLSMGIMGGVSSVVTGIVVDAVPRLDRVRVQQLAFLLQGVAISCLPLAGSFPALACVCMVITLGGGMFLAVQAPIAFELVGVQGASQALGFLYAFYCLPITMGPPLAGLLYDHLGSYRLAFHLAGIPAVLGSLFLCLVPRASRRRTDRSTPRATDGQPLKGLPPTEAGNDTEEQQPFNVAVAQTQALTPTPSQTPASDSQPPSLSTKLKPNCVTSDLDEGSHKVL